MRSRDHEADRRSVWRNAWDDLGQRLSTVHTARMKAGATHEVPLSDAAVAILKALTPDNPPSDGILLSAPRGGMMSDMALSQLLKRMGRGDITVHGFRSTFRDWAGEATQFGREEVEMALAHTIESTTERAYRRGRALDKRRDLMAAWANYCLPAQDDLDVAIPDVANSGAAGPGFDTPTA